jgi:hypothetical protein
MKNEIMISTTFRTLNEIASKLGYRNICVDTNNVPFKNFSIFINNYDYLDDFEDDEDCLDEDFDLDEEWDETDEDDLSLFDDEDEDLMCDFVNISIEPCSIKIDSNLIEVELKSDNPVINDISKCTLNINTFNKVKMMELLEEGYDYFETINIMQESENGLDYSKEELEEMDENIKYLVYFMLHLLAYLSYPSTLENISVNRTIIKKPAKKNKNGKKKKGSTKNLISFEQK